MEQARPLENDAIRLRPRAIDLRSRSIGHIASLVSLALVYITAGKIGLRFASIHPSATAIWAPSGIALGACLLWGARLWPAIFIGAFLVNLTTVGSLPTSLGIAVGNTSEALLGAYLVARFANGRRVFDRTRDASKFLVLAAMLSTALAATIGVTSLCVGGYAKWSEYGWIWLTWWLGDAAGDLLIAPLIVLWGLNYRLDWSREQTVEAVLLLLSTVVTGSVVFGGWLPLPERQYPLDFLCFPVLLWAAFRFGPRETATVNFISSGIAVVGTLNGFGPFARGTQNEALLLLQTFAGLTQLTIIAVATEIAQRRSLDKAREQLLNSEQIARAEAERALSMLRRLQMVTDAALSQSTPQELMPALLDRLRSALAADAAAIFLADPEGRYLTPVSSVGLREESRERAELKIPFGQGVAGKIAVSQDGLIFDDLSTASAIAPLLRTQLKSLAGAPMRVDERVIGIIHVATRELRKFTVDDLRLIDLVAERAAFAIVRTQLHEGQRAAREAAEAANRAKDEFLAMLGHELRNPINAISLAARLLRMEQTTDGNALKAQSIIERQVEHVIRLVDDLLDAARVSTGKIVLVTRPVNLAVCVSECLAGWHETRQLEGRTVELDLHPVWVHGDVDRLTQIVSNLLGNAIKYTAPGAYIRISAKAEAENAVIRVKDTGIGIAPELLPRIFDLFARGDLGLARFPGGLGIGLTLVKRLTELHGGSVQALSEGPGRGSEFVVQLPMLASPPAPEPPAPEPTAPSQPAKAGGAHRILIVEDNDDSRESLRQLLELLGHEVSEAADGPSGVEAALGAHPDIALIDIGLPGFNGYEVARRIRSDLAGSAIILIALTGYPNDEYRRKAVDAGFDAYLVKPTDPDELSRLIASRS